MFYSTISIPYNNFFGLSAEELLDSPIRFFPISAKFCLSFKACYKIYSLSLAVWTISRSSSLIFFFDLVLQAPFVNVSEIWNVNYIELEGWFAEFVKPVYANWLANSSNQLDNQILVFQCGLLFNGLKLSLHHELFFSRLELFGSRTENKTHHFILWCLPVVKNQSFNVRDVINVIGFYPATK